MTSSGTTGRRRIRRIPIRNGGNEGSNGSNGNRGSESNAANNGMNATSVSNSSVSNAYNNIIITPRVNQIQRTNAAIIPVRRLNLTFQASNSTQTNRINTRPTQGNRNAHHNANNNASVTNVQNHASSTGSAFTANAASAANTHQRTSSQLVIGALLSARASYSPDPMNNGNANDVHIQETRNNSSNFSASMPNATSMGTRPLNRASQMALTNILYGRRTQQHPQRQTGGPVRLQRPQRQGTLESPVRQSSQVRQQRQSSQVRQHSQQSRPRGTSQPHSHRPSRQTPIRLSRNEQSSVNERRATDSTINSNNNNPPNNTAIARPRGHNSTMEYYGTTTQRNDQLSQEKNDDANGRERDVMNDTATWMRYPSQPRSQPKGQLQRQTDGQARQGSRADTQERQADGQEGQDRHYGHANAQDRHLDSQRIAQAGQERQIGQRYEVRQDNATAVTRDIQLTCLNTLNYLLELMPAQMLRRIAHSDSFFPRSTMHRPQQQRPSSPSYSHASLRRSNTTRVQEPMVRELTSEMARHEKAESTDLPAQQPNTTVDTTAAGTTTGTVARNTNARATTARTTIGAAAGNTNAGTTAIPAQQHTIAQSAPMQSTTNSSNAQLLSHVSSLSRPLAKLLIFELLSRADHIGLTQVFSYRINSAVHSTEILCIVLVELVNAGALVDTLRNNGITFDSQFFRVISDILANCLKIPNHPLMQDSSSLASTSQQQQPY